MGGTELHELVDWLNHRCEGCLDGIIKNAKAALAKEIQVLQKEHEKQWASDFASQEEQLTAEERVVAQKLELRARQMAEEEMLRKEELRQKAEMDAKERWQKQQELLWQRQEEQKAEAMAEKEKKEQQKREAELAQLRKDKLAQKLSLYDKEAHAQWVEIEEQEQASKERKAAQQAEAELTVTRQHKLAEKKRRFALAEKAASMEAERQIFLGKFWPSLRPVVATFFREVRVESLDDAITGSPFTRADSR